MNPNQDLVNALALAAAFLTLLATFLTVLKSWFDLKKLKESVNQIQVVANTREMKEALIKPLEGLWNVNGTFDKYQGIDAKHFSSGYAIFLWDDSHDRYEVVYSYSVLQEHQNTDCVTAICHGYALLEKNGTSHNITLRMQIKNITSAENIASPQNRSFVLTAHISPDIEISKSLRDLTFPFQTDITGGTICFKR